MTPKTKAAVQRVVLRTLEATVEQNPEVRVADIDTTRVETTSTTVCLLLEELGLIPKEA